jgi:hypothetical protein
MTTGDGQSGQRSTMPTAALSGSDMIRSSRVVAAAWLKSSGSCRVSPARASVSYLPAFFRLFAGAGSVGAGAGSV